MLMMARNSHNKEPVAQRLGVPLGKEMTLVLGQSFMERPQNLSESYHTLRYDFKPASIDPTQNASLEIGANNSVTVTAANTEGSSAPGTVFKGNSKPYTKECVLIIDHETGQITLERLVQNMTVKTTRMEGSSKAQAYGLHAPGGSGGGGQAPRPSTPSLPPQHQQQQHNQNSSSSGAMVPSPSQPPTSSTMAAAAAKSSKKTSKSNSKSLLSASTSSSSSSASRLPNSPAASKQTTNKKLKLEKVPPLPPPPPPPVIKSTKKIDKDRNHKKSTASVTNVMEPMELSQDDLDHAAELLEDMIGEDSNPPTPTGHQVDDCPPAASMPQILNDDNKNRTNKAEDKELYMSDSESSDDDDDDSDDSSSDSSDSSSDDDHHENAGGQNKTTVQNDSQAIPPSPRSFAPPLMPSMPSMSSLVRPLPLPPPPAVNKLSQLVTNDLQLSESGSDSD